MMLALELHDHRVDGAARPAIAHMPHRELPERALCGSPIRVDAPDAPPGCERCVVCEQLLERPR